MDLIEAIAIVSKTHVRERLPFGKAYIDVCAEDGEAWPCATHIVLEAAEGVVTL